MSWTKTQAASLSREGLNVGLLPSSSRDFELQGRKWTRTLFISSHEVLTSTSVLPGSGIATCVGFLLSGSGESRGSKIRRAESLLLYLDYPVHSLVLVLSECSRYRGSNYSGFQVQGFKFLFIRGCLFVCLRVQYSRSGLI